MNRYMDIKFSLIQKVRNKIKIKGDPVIHISKRAKIIGCRIVIKGFNNKLVIGSGSVLRDMSLEIVGNNCSIIIGEDTMIGEDCYLSAKEGKVLEVGNRCMFSRNAKIMTSDGHNIYKNQKIINPGGNIFIKQDVWLADNVTVLKNVSIAEGSIIGINSTITKNVPAKVITVGNPAKIIKKGIDYWDK